MKYLLPVSTLFFLLTFTGYGCRENLKLFAGGFTDSTEQGMALFELDPKSGKIEEVLLADAGPNPAYFCFSDRHHLIYSMNEVNEFRGIKGGGITTLKYDPGKNEVVKVNEITVPEGGPCHISLSADSDFLFIASYGSGSVAVVQLDDKGIPVRVTDTILYVTAAPDVSHPHMISHDPAGSHVYLADLGLNRIMIYNLDKSSGKLIQAEKGEIKLPAGSGPRHFIFNDEGTKLYVINELGSSVMVFDVDPKGLLNPVQTISTVREGFTGKNSCAEILIDRNGEYLYGSNRGENSIVVFRIDENGLLKLAGHSSCGGDWPRNFVIDPSGEFLLSGNQRSNQISVFKIDHRSGLPEGPVSYALMKAPAYMEFWK